MRIFCLTLVLLLCSCTTPLKREAHCLEALTPGYLQAQREVAELEASWRQASYEATAAIAQRVEARGTGAQSAASADRLKATGLEVAEARFRTARLHHQRTMEWYDRVYRRVRVRMEEEELLSEVFWTLLPGPGIVFYPIARWNLHAVMWDGIDPDAQTDPIRRFCADLETKSSRDGG